MRALVSLYKYQDRLLKATKEDKSLDASICDPLAEAIEQVRSASDKIMYCYGDKKHFK